MKKIQFLTDYSRYSQQVWHYTLHLAHHFEATVYATHIFHPDYTQAIAEFSKIEGDDAHDQLKNFIGQHQEEEEKKLDNFVNTLSPPELQHVSVVKAVVYGSPAEEILRLHNMMQFDLVIMGLNTNPTIDSNVIGNTAQAIINQSNIPILLIPPRATYQHIRRIVLPTHHLQEELETLNYLLEWTTALHAKLFCYHLKTAEESENDDLTITDLLTIENIYLAYKEDELAFSFSEGAKKDLIHHIEKMTSVLNADILALTTHKIGFFQKVFTTNPVKTIAADLSIPVLILKTEWLSDRPQSARSTDRKKNSTLITPT
jgi:nucleotide-binding universal stress UspA family protein